MSAHNHLHFGDLIHRPTQRLALSLSLTLGFVGIEAFAGWYANSLALLTDAAHNITDVIALALSWYAMRLTLQPAHAGKTFGYHRAGILVALINSATLVAIALWIFYEAYERLLHPPTLEASVLMVVAFMAFLVNTGTALLVMRGSEHDLNLRSAFVHLAGDAVSTFGAFVAGIIILLSGWAWLDPVVSIFIGSLILWNAWHILRETVDILLESTPRDIDMGAMVQDLMNIEGVRGVHDLHVWSLTQNVRALSAHVLTDNGFISDCMSIQRALNELLLHKYNIAHTTLQMECVDCEPNLLYCNLTVNHAQQHSH